MANETKAKEPNIRLKEGAEPITVSGYASVGASMNRLAFPTEERQKNGWCSGDAKLIVQCYPDRYELINGGCNCNG